MAAASAADALMARLQLAGAYVTQARRFCRRRAASAAAASRRSRLRTAAEGEGGGGGRRIARGISGGENNRQGCGPTQTLCAVVVAAMERQR